MTHLYLDKVLLAGGLLLLAACASPLVHYEPIAGEDREGKSKLHIAESVIKFDYGKTNSGVTNYDVINITSVPVPHGTKRFAISGTDYLENWGVETKIQVSYRGDSTLIQEIGVEVADKRQELIQGLGQAAAAVGGLLALTVDLKKPTLPAGISVSDLLADTPETCSNTKGDVTKPVETKPVEQNSRGIDRNAGVTCKRYRFPDTTDFTADITLSTVPIDAVPASVLERSFKSGSFYYSACRSMTVTLIGPKDSRTAVTVAVADPAWLQTLKFPNKGKVAVQPSCGANAVASDARLPTGMDYINSLLATAKAVKEGFKNMDSKNK